LRLLEDGLGLELGELVAAYGDHLVVACYVHGSDHRVWYRLADQNFMSGQDLVLAPLSDGSPPPC
jgi:hypothetical protein